VSVSASCPGSGCTCSGAAPGVRNIRTPNLPTSSDRTHSAVHVRPFLRPRLFTPPKPPDRTPIHRRPRPTPTHIDTPTHPPSARSITRTSRYDTAPRVSPRTARPETRRGAPSTPHTQHSQPRLVLPLLQFAASISSVSRPRADRTGLEEQIQPPPRHPHPNTPGQQIAASRACRPD